MYAYGSSHPLGGGTDYGLALGLVSILAFIAAIAEFVWLVRGALAFGQRFIPLREAAVYLLPFAACALLIAIERSGILFELRFSLSRNALEEAVRDPELVDRWAGLYYVDFRHEDGPRTLLRTSKSLLNDSGLAYCPTGPPAEPSSWIRYHQHIDGPWWVWSGGSS